MSNKRLIINADDYCYSPGVNRGILEAHQKGIVTSTSVMITMPGSIAAVHDALITAPKLGLGLHITLAGDGLRPILPPEEIPTLVRPDGTFYPPQEWESLRNALSADELRREICAQCDCFTDIAKHPPDHLDSHYHAAYKHPAAREAMFDLAAQYHIPVRKFKSAPNYPPHPDHFEDGFGSIASTLGDLLVILANLQDGVTELMCHPGYVDDVPDSSLQRDVELASLTHPSVLELIKSEGIELINFSALAE